MLYLILAIMSSAMVSIVMRMSEKRVHGNVGMLAVNYVMCTLLAGNYVGAGNLFPTDFQRSSWRTLHRKTVQCPATRASALRRSQLTCPR